MRTLAFLCARNYFLTRSAPSGACRVFKRLIEISDNIIEMLDSYAEPDHLG